MNDEFLLNFQFALFSALCISPAKLLANLINVSFLRDSDVREVGTVFHFEVAFREAIVVLVSFRGVLSVALVLTDFFS